MDSILNWIRKVRVSSLIFAAFLPFIFYFIFTSRNYGKALKAILGVEENALALLSAFILFSAIGILGFFAALRFSNYNRPDTSIENRERALFLGQIFLISQIFVYLILINSNFLDPYIVSVAANSMDARNTEWIIIVNQSFTLEETVKAKIIVYTRTLLVIGLFFSVFVLVYGSLFKKYLSKVTSKILIFILGFTHIVLAFYVIMVAHAGFALGLAVTLRAAFFAYFLASVLGLIWALLTKLKASKTATYIFLILGCLSIVISIYNFTRPHQSITLVGDVKGKIGIIVGTPRFISDQVRYGDFLSEKPDKPFKIRSIKNTEQAIDLYMKNKLSGLLISSDQAQDFPSIWTASYLPSKNRTIAVFSAVIGFLFILLVAIGRLTNMHPLTIFSDFFVDTIRGIPMLVIILYIGLPLAGALKTSSGGYIDMQMMTRGIIAIGIGYSAYMAEIFRAGIEAISKGQIEAARSLGMRETHIARFIILPQAIAIVLPALGNEFIAMLKDTSLVSILSVRDITQRMREFQAQSFLPFEPFNSAALLYIILTLLAASGIKSLEKAVNRGRSASSRD